MGDVPVRPWCAELVYAGLSPFIAGTVLVPARTGEEAVRQAMKKEMLEHLPDGFNIVRLIAGAVIFLADEDNA